LLAVGLEVGLEATPHAPTHQAPQKNPEAQGALGVGAEPDRVWMRVSRYACAQHQVPVSPGLFRSALYVAVQTLTQSVSISSRKAGSKSIRQLSQLLKMPRNPVVSTPHKKSGLLLSARALRPRSDTGGQPRSRFCHFDHRSGFHPRLHLSSPTPSFHTPPSAQEDSIPFRYVSGPSSGQPIHVTHPVFSYSPKAVLGGLPRSPSSRACHSHAPGSGSHVS